MEPNTVTDSPLSDLLDQEHKTRLYLLDVYKRKAKNKLFFAAVIIFIFDAIAILRFTGPTAEAWFSVLLVPVLFVGLGFLCLREPLVSVIIAIAIIVAVWSYHVYLVGGAGLFVGYVPKILVTFMLLAGLQSAWQAHKVARELKA